MQNVTLDKKYLITELKDVKKYSFFIYDNKIFLSTGQSYIENGQPFIKAINLQTQKEETINCLSATCTVPTKVNISYFV